MQTVHMRNILIQIKTYNQQGFAMVLGGSAMGGGGQGGQKPP